MTVVGGVPLMLGPPPTVIENQASAAPLVPSLTAMLMPEKVPTLAFVGLPLRSPEVVLKVAQEGLPVIE